MRRFLTPVLLALIGACGNGGGANPFTTDAGAPADASGGGDQGAADAPYDGPPLGGPCLEQSHCDDGVGCTFDLCNTAFARCQHVPDDTRCQNGALCDGVERCDARLGCRPGPPLDCNDDSTCTIDACVEATQTCRHQPRDADGDGSPDGHCVPDADCDDADPGVYPGHPEVCGNRKDDDCDGAIDESPCQQPQHDTCASALAIRGSGVYQLDTTGAAFDYPGSCALTEIARRDVVAALEVSGGPSDVDLIAEASSGALALGAGRACGDPTSEIGCAASAAGPAGNRLARVRLRSLPDGAYPLYVWADRDEEVILRATFGPSTAQPTNETCGTAAPIAVGVPVVASLTGARRDLASRCGLETGDLVYSFTLAAASDVTLHAASTDGLGVPVVSLRGEGCVSVADELRCGFGAPVATLARSVPPGKYYVAVSASAPTDVRLEVEAAPPSTPPADETCAGAPPLAVNRTVDVDLAGHSDDIQLECGRIGYVDAAYALELPTASDVLLVERIASSDTGALGLLSAACGDPPVRLCEISGGSPVRIGARGVPAGSYRAVIESRIGGPVQVTALVRPAIPPAVVPFADDCATAATIAEAGGFYQGNTANAGADYSAGCDVGGRGPGGAPDQMLKLVLTARKRVVFDMRGSGYTTLLDVRQGATCPGTEITRGCSVGYGAPRSFLDLTLEAGTYWVQVDGYGDEAGAWFLDVRVVDP